MSNELSCPDRFFFFRALLFTGPGAGGGGGEDAMCHNVCTGHRLQGNKTVWFMDVPRSVSLWLMDVDWAESASGG